jgi:L-iditol 2-dehydrogenase
MSAPVSTAAPSMTVAACAGGGAVRLEARPLPEPGPGEIRLRLRCAGLCGTDLVKLARGSAPAGSVLGHEIVGTVDVLGSDLSTAAGLGFATGDRVVVPHHVACGECSLCRHGAETLCPQFKENLLVPGGFSEHLVVRERAVRLALFGIPDHLSDEAAVFLEPAACVLRGVRHALRALGETAAAEGGPWTAAILGAGSMGLLHLLVLKAVLPAARTLIVDPLEERRTVALRLGAGAAAPPGEAARNALRSLTAGAESDGADAVFDTAGGADALAAALDLARPGGATVLFAHAGDRGEPSGFALDPFFKSERKLLATYSGAREEQNEIWRLLVTGRLDPSPLVTHRLPLSCFAEAVELARDRRALKILLVPDGESA